MDRDGHGAFPPGYRILCSFKTSSCTTYLSPIIPLIPCRSHLRSSLHGRTCSTAESFSKSVAQLLPEEHQLPSPRALWLCISKTKVEHLPSWCLVWVLICTTETNVVSWDILLPIHLEMAELWDVQNLTSLITTSHSRVPDLIVSDPNVVFWGNSLSFWRTVTHYTRIVVSLPRIRLAILCVALMHDPMTMSKSRSCTLHLKAFHCQWRSC